MQYVLIAYTLLKYRRAFKSIYFLKVLKNKAFKSIKKKKKNSYFLKNKKFF